jgi:hypothetical protein
MFTRLIGTKTFWTGVAGIVGGIIAITQKQVETGIGAIFVGLQTIFIRDAIAKQDDSSTLAK